MGSAPRASFIPSPNRYVRMSGDDSDETRTTRRAVFSLIGAAVLYASGWVSNAVAQVTPSGTIANDSEPALIVYADTVNYYPRTSDPSNTEHGESWFNEDA